MVTDAMCSNMAFVVTDQGLRMACLTPPTHFLQSFLRIWGAPPALIVVGSKATEVHFVETTKDLVEGVVAEEQG